MDIAWSKVQRQRLVELNADPSFLEHLFENTRARDKAFQELDKKLVTENKKNLFKLKTNEFRPLLCQLESKLTERLTQEGFVQVVTPHILPKEMLDKMTITSEHPLSNQVFWVDKNKCLRPMLAPNLYSLLRDLERIWEKPIKIFEIGTCFRKESQGANHLNEFTMLNLVELGELEGKQTERLKELAHIVMEAADITNYSLENCESEVYIETIDVVVNDLEIGSGAYGPHSLDNSWGIFDPWVGIGFGLERLVTVKKGFKNIRRTGRSISYLDGSRLNI
ncbi:MAG: Pyrrolysine--tRNA(Pyl) ligase [Desulfitibacter sp. BRH_c19]|nr:MAG: Pyrrolysine--tRNA(Pyl) ligase [Desulfitibacter sp. BRH_c19]